MFRMIKVILIANLIINNVKSVHVVRRSNVSSEFSQLIYQDLDIRHKEKFMFLQIEEVVENYDCLSECNFEKLCRFGYFLNSICYICNKSAENYLIDFRNTPGKKATDGTLFRRTK